MHVRETVITNQLFLITSPSSNTVNKNKRSQSIVFNYSSFLHSTHRWKEKDKTTKRSSMLNTLWFIHTIP